MIKIFCLGLGLLLHGYHVSLTEIRFNAKEKSYEVEMKIFTDDLEKALSLENKQHVTLAKPTDAHDALIARYVQQRFGIVGAKGQRWPSQYLGQQQEGEATWIFVEISAQGPLTGTQIQQTVLTEIYDDQRNLVNVLSPEKKSFFFDKNQKIQSF
jgi:hypothetical protein